MLKIILFLFSLNSLAALHQPLRMGTTGFPTKFVVGDTLLVDSAKISTTLIFSDGTSFTTATTAGSVTGSAPISVTGGVVQLNYNPTNLQILDSQLAIKSILTLGGLNVSGPISGATISGSSYVSAPSLYSGGFPVLTTVSTAATATYALNSGLLDGLDSLYFLDRSNHTGTQLASTISDFNEAAQDAISFTDNNPITWTYNDALGTFTAGLQFNTTNLKLTTNKLNTTQDISSTSSPTFANLTVNATVTATTITGSSYISAPVLYSNGLPALNTGSTASTSTNATLLNSQPGTFYLDRSNHTGTQLASTISNSGTWLRTDIADDANGLITFNAGISSTSVTASGPITGTSLTASNVTSGTVLYATTSGAISGDANNFYYDSVGKKTFFGPRQTLATATVSISSTGLTNGLYVRNATTSGNGATFFGYSRAIQATCTGPTGSSCIGVLSDGGGSSGSVGLYGYSSSSTGRGVYSQSSGDAIVAQADASGTGVIGSSVSGNGGSFSTTNTTGGAAAVTGEAGASEGGIPVSANYAVQGTNYNFAGGDASGYFYLLQYGENTAQSFAVKAFDESINGIGIKSISTNGLAGFFTTSSTTSPSVFIDNDGGGNGLYVKTGNSGFGIASPSTRIEYSGTISGTTSYVSTGTASAPTYSFGTDTNTGMYSPAVDAISFSSGSTETMRLKANGRVGIGTTSPTGQLDVNGTIVSGNGIFRLITGSSNTSGQWAVSGGNTFFDFFGDLNIRTALSSTKMTIENASGNVKIGASLTANTAISTAALTVTSAISLTGSLSLSGPAQRIYINGSGANKVAGTAVLVGGTVTVANTSVTANTLIFPSNCGVGVLANVGQLYSSKIAGTSFTISSVNVLDTSQICWLLIEN